MKVALFVTCLTDTFYPRAGRAVVAVLEHLGCTVEFPERQTCCGQPMFNSGYPSDAADLARRMVDVFDGYDHVVTPSGSCCAMVHEYYPQLLADDPAYAKRADTLIRSTHEFVQFLTDVVKVDLRRLGCKWPGRATYHYSCHLRGIGMKTEAVDLMAQIEGLEHIPLEKRDQCCGFGGTFAVKYSEISGSMAHDKATCIAATGADTLVCNDAGCAMNITGTLNRDGHEIKTYHIAEIIAEGLGLRIDG